MRGEENKQSRKKKLIRNAKHRLLQRDTIRRTDDAALGGLAAGNNLLHGETEVGLLRVTKKKSFKGHDVGKLLIPRLIN